VTLLVATAIRRSASLKQHRKLVVVVVVGNTNLDGEVLAVVH